MERTFFNVIRKFAMGMTVIAFILTAAYGVLGVIKSNTVADTSIKPLRVDYDAMRQMKKAQKEAQKQSAAEAPGLQRQHPQSNPDDIPVEYLRTLSDIEISLKTFAHDTQQAEPTNDTRSKIYKRAKTIASEVPIATSLGLLEAEAKKLVDDAPRIKAIPPDDPEYIMWGDFLKFFFSALYDDFYQQQQSIRTEKERVEKEKEGGRQAFQYATYSFFVLTILIFYLLLLGVERNTHLIRASLEAGANAAHPPTQSEEVGTNAAHPPMQSDPRTL